MKKGIDPPASTRRAALGALLAAPAVVALGASAAMASLPADRAEWDRAFAAYEAAKAEDDAFNAIYERLDARCSEALEAVAHITVGPDPYSGRNQPVTTADQRAVMEARSLVKGVNAGKIKLDLIPSLQEHLAFSRELAGAADRRDAEVDAIRARFGMDEAEAKWEALGERVSDAKWELMALPAPDGPALLWKLNVLLEEHAVTWAPKAIAPTMADAHRLLRGEG